MMDATGETVASVIDALRTAGCVFAEDEAALLIAAACDGTELEQMVRARCGGRPLECILGFVEFCGMRMEVTDGVFVPRRRTEFLVGSALGLLEPSATGTRPVGPGGGIRPVVLDLCCGCGAIGAAIAHLTPVELHACDIDPAAVRSARTNVEPPGGQVYEGDLYGPLPEGLRGRIDVLVVNAPYVPTDALELMPPEARLYEPRIALDGGQDGLDVQRRVITGAPQWLAAGGHLLIETGEDQSARTAEAMLRNSFAAEIRTSDEFYATVVIGRLSSG